MKHTPGPWIYEEGSDTIRSMPENYWIATIDSFEGAVIHEANARAISKVPEMIELLKNFHIIHKDFNQYGTFSPEYKKITKLLAEIEGDK